VFHLCFSYVPSGVPVQMIVGQLINIQKYIWGFPARLNTVVTLNLPEYVRIIVILRVRT
jgi:hypothetical protein